MVDKLKNDLKIKNEKLKEFRKDKKLISFSMLNTIETCFRQYKFLYVDKIVGTKENIYTYLGSLAHSLIEKLYRNEITNEEAVSEWVDKVTNCEYYFVKYTRAENVDTRKEMEEKRTKAQLELEKARLAGELGNEEDLDDLDKKIDSL